MVEWWFLNCEIWNHSNTLIGRQIPWSVFSTMLSQPESSLPLEVLWCLSALCFCFCCCCYLLIFFLVLLKNLAGVGEWIWILWFIPQLACQPPETGQAEARSLGICAGCPHWWHHLQCPGLHSSKTLHPQKSDSLSQALQHWLEASPAVMKPHANACPHSVCVARACVETVSLFMVRVFGFISQAFWLFHCW